MKFCAVIVFLNHDLFILTLQHAVVGLPVPPPESFPESHWFRSFIAFPNGHSAAAVEPRLQRTAAQHQNKLFKLQIHPDRPARKQTAVHSLLFEFVGAGARHIPRVLLGFAPVPQVDESLAAVQQHHGDPGAQTAAVADHLQQMALHCHLPSHAVQTPVG